MHKQPGESRVTEGSRLERAIVLQLLRDDHERMWSLEQLASELGADAPAVQSAVWRLCAAGVLLGSGGRISAAPAALRIDELGLIGV